MNIIGKWTFKGMNIPTEDGMTYYDKDEIPEDILEDLEGSEKFVVEFLEDGTYNMLQKADDEVVAEAEEEGLEIRDDGYVVFDTAKWEDRDGTIYYDTGAEGTIMDEEIDPFEPLEFNEDGCMWFNYGMMLFEHE